LFFRAELLLAAFGHNHAAAMYCIAAEQTGRCPLYSRKRTLGLNREMSALWTPALQQTIPFFRWPNASGFVRHLSTL
jgi:hypothetical protein